MGAGDEIKGWLKQISEQQPIQRTSCPRCEWTLTKREQDGVLHCEYCGWTDGVVLRGSNS